MPSDCKRLIKQYEDSKKGAIKVDAAYDGSYGGENRRGSSELVAIYKSFI